MMKAWIFKLEETDSLIHEIIKPMAAPFVVLPSERACQRCRPHTAWNRWIPVPGICCGRHVDALYNCSFNGLAIQAAHGSLQSHSLPLFSMVVFARKFWLQYFKATSEALEIQNICGGIGLFDRYFLVLFN